MFSRSVELRPGTGLPNKNLKFVGPSTRLPFPKRPKTLKVPNHEKPQSHNSLITSKQSQAQNPHKTQNGRAAEVSPAARPPIMVNGKIFPAAWQHGKGHRRRGGVSCGQRTANCGKDRSSARYCSTQRAKAQAVDTVTLRRTAAVRPAGTEYPTGPAHTVPAAS